MTGPTLPPVSDPSNALLRCVRLDPAGWARLRAGSAPPLGGLAWGAAGGAGALAGGAMRVLSPQGVCIDAWLGGALQRSGRTGQVVWQDDGRWAFGHVDVAEAGAGGAGDLAELAYRAYLDVFGTLRELGGLQPLRLWNYLPRINEDGGGLERYRQFNIGRQRAFIDAGYDAFEGAPAACALGTHGGGLGIRFLAARQAPRPVENPRQVPAYRYSTLFGPRSPTFSRAAVADAGGGRVALLVSGTASIVGEHSLHPGDLQAQLEETLRNLHAVIEAANAQCTAGFSLAELDCTVYLRDAGDTDALRRAFEAGVGADSAAARGALYLEADICRSDLLVEIEGHAIAPGVLR